MQVIIVNPVDSDAVAPAVESAIAANIPVIALDRIVNGVEVTTQISSDNVAGAKMAGEYLIELDVGLVVPHCIISPPKKEPRQM